MFTKLLFLPEEHILELWRLILELCMLILEPGS
jgi:hypothetical protein